MSVVVRRLLFLAAVVACAVAASGVAAAGVTARSADRHPTAAANKRAAERDAQRLLALAALPTGAVRIPAEPSGDHGLLNGLSSRSTGLLIDRHGWWTVAAGLQSVVAFLKAHPPAGSTLTSTGFLSGLGIPENENLEFSLPPVAGVISSRQLMLNVVALSRGVTGIRIDAQDSWILPRPPAERVPAGVRLIQVTSAQPGQPPIVSLAVSNPSAIRRIVRLIDSVPIVQPGATSCPGLLAGAPVVTFRFLGAANQPALAQASLTDYGFYSGPCNPISFSVRGRAMTPLLGGSLMNQVQRLLHVRLA